MDIVNTTQSREEPFKLPFEIDSCLVVAVDPENSFRASMLVATVKDGDLQTVAIHCAHRH